MSRRWVRAACAATTMLVVCGPVAVRAQSLLSRPRQEESCTSAAGSSAADAIRRAESAMGVPNDGRALHFRSMGSRAMDFQSDRSYPPFFDAPEETNTWYDPAAGVELRHFRGVYPGNGPAGFATMVSAATASWFVRDTLIAIPTGHEDAARTRRLNPWAVIHDWIGSNAEVRVAGTCTARDYPRLVLERTDNEGVRERLYLDPKTGMPVQLVRVEPHATWGQYRTEYIWSVWFAVDGPHYFPMASFRVVDGDIERHRTLGEVALADRDSAAFPAVPSPIPVMRTDPTLSSFTAQPPDTVRIAPNAFVLAQRAYNEVVVLERDTVFILDATMSDARARQDSAWIARLFPGTHPLVVVVTDLAWPHIGGVRFWVARGATVISHAINRPFLEKLVDRRWTLAPDALENVRPRAVFRFRAVTDSLVLAGGAIRLHAINGIGSEGAVMAWLPQPQFLWAGDFIQDLRGPSLYATEVIRAVRRVGIAPTRAAAQHVPMFMWSRVLDANAAMGAGGAARD